MTDIADVPKVLVPYNRREAISLAQAAKIAGRCETTIRGWCARFHIGRRVVGGPWQVSWPALKMLLDNDQVALRAYHAGDRSSSTVSAYMSAPMPGRLIRRTEPSDAT